MGAIRILVVDGDESTHRSVRSALGGRPYEVVCVSDGEAALQMAGQHPPDIMLVEPRLSKVDGLTVVRTLRTRPEFALVPVIFLADRREVESHILGFRMGADDFLPKPVNFQELDLLVTTALKVRQETEIRVRPKPPASPDFSVPMMGFRGTLEQIGLPSLLSLLEMDRKTGMLVVIVEPENEKARLYLRDGRVLRARFDRRGEPCNADLVYELLSRAQGKFDFRPGVIDPGDEIRTSTAMILMEGARRIDETQRRGKGE
jgi:CheY-like chemotaxis protein